MRAIAVTAAAALLAACATVDEPGWTGSGAEPFDTAQAACEIETQSNSGAQFEACMAGRGWTRPR